MKMYSMLEGFVDNKYLKRLSSLEQVKKYVGGDPVVSKLGAASKTKQTHDWRTAE